MVKKKAETMKSSDMSLRSCSRKRSRSNDEKDKNKDKKKIKIQTQEQEDMGLRSCTTLNRKKVLSEEEEIMEKKKMKYLMMKNIISKKEDHMVDLLSCFKLKRFGKKNKSAKTCVRKPPFLGNWSCLKQKSKFKKGDRVRLKELLFSEDRDFLITYNDRSRPGEVDKIRALDLIMVKKKAETMKSSDMSLRSCSRKRSRSNDEKDKNKDKKKIKIQTQEQEDMGLRSCTTLNRKKVLSEEEEIMEKKKMKYLMMKDIISKKEDHMVDLLSCFKLKRFGKKNKSAKTCVRKPPFLGNWSCLKQKSKFKKGDRVRLKELLFSEDRDFLITYNDRSRPGEVDKIRALDLIMVKKKAETMKSSDMSLRSCSRKRSRSNDEKDKNKDKKKIKIQTQEQEDMGLRSCITLKRKKILSEEEEIMEKKKMKYLMMKDIISKKEDHMVDLLACFKLKRFGKKNKSAKTCVRKPPFLGNWSCLKQKSKFKKGDRVRLKELLFSEDRDFLITYDDRSRPVQATHLEGKVIVLHFVPLVPWPEYFMRYETTILMDIYHALHARGGFEVVFIGVEVDSTYTNSNSHTLEECFEEKLSIMPWTTIPFSDIKFRTYWETLFPLSNYLAGYSPTSFVIDPTGMVLQCNVNDLFYLYGARAYPFTDERMKCILREDDRARKRPSITKLLASSGRTHLINNNNQAVPLHNLEDKVVGLYFYEDYPNHELTLKIQKAYDQLAKEENFEIVFVYIHDTFMTFGDASEKSYWKTFKKMPWLALPFKDPVCKKLQRVFKYPMDALGPGPDPSLLIIGPQGKFVERYGADILMKHGISAYPFTRNRVAKLEVECIKELNLNMFWGRNTTFVKNDGSMVPLSKLTGKRIIVIVEDDCHSPNAKFWRMLRVRYLQVKGTENEFEVIHICKNKTAYSYGKNIATMSWLRHPSRHPPYRAGFNVSNILVRVFRQALLGLFAFDRDGRVVRRILFPSIERRNVDFPFGDMENEFLRELVDRFTWDY